MKKLLPLVFVLGMPLIGSAQTDRGSDRSEERPVTDQWKEEWRSRANPNTATPNTGATAQTKESTKKTFRVADMDCAGCEARVQNAVRKVPGVRSVTADARAGQVSFTVEERGRVDETAVVRAIENEGFRVLR